MRGVVGGEGQDRGRHLLRGGEALPPSGSMRFHSSGCSFGTSVTRIGVCTNPGATVFTVILYGASDFARPRLRDTMPLLFAV
jgi:hypothetical protein